jgi:hypothetical protein
MLDARLLLAHALWISGAATLLAAFGYVSWEARTAHASRRSVFRSSRGWRVFNAIGLALIAVGLLLMPGTAAWARAAWALVLAAVAFDLWQLRTS